MKICVECHIELRCLKNGVGADFGHGHVYPGDLYMCPSCKTKVIFCNANSIQDTDYTTQELYVEVDEEKQKMHDIPDALRDVTLEIISDTWEAQRDAS